MNLIVQSRRKWLINVYRFFFLLTLQAHYRVNLTEINFRSSSLTASSAVVAHNSFLSEPFSHHPCVLKSHAITYNASRWRNTVTVGASEFSSQIPPGNFSFSSEPVCMRDDSACLLLHYYHYQPKKLQNSNI